MRPYSVARDPQKRLCHRYRHLPGGGKLMFQASTAVAWLLAAFLWAVGRAVLAPTAKVKTSQKERTTNITSDALNAEQATKGNH